jgi:hypothetical protein
MIEKRLPQLEGIFEELKRDLGNDYLGYKNHVYRMVHFCLRQRQFSDQEREIIIIAGCFHDIGIWTAHTFDYLPPSIAAASEYLKQNGRQDWIAEIRLMIDQHHRLRKYPGGESSLVEVFRKGDLVDFSLGTVKCGLSRDYIREVREQFPNRGFHKGLLKVAGRWFLRHPFHPAPVLKW